MQLQIGQPTDGLPDTLPIEPWTGLSGASAKYALGSTVRVSFFAGDPSRPIVDSYQPGALPLTSTVDATEEVVVGPSAPLVVLAGGKDFLALATPYQELLAALAAFVSGLNPTTLAAQAGTLATFLASPAMASPFTTKTKAT